MRLDPGNSTSQVSGFTFELPVSSSQSGVNGLKVSTWTDYN